MTAGMPGESEVGEGFTRYSGSMSTCDIRVSSEVPWVKIVMEIKTNSE